MNSSKQMSGVEIGQTWRHVKTETDYTIVGFCLMEKTCQPAVLYTDGGLDSFGDAVVWVRDRGEFMDGRFQLEKIK